MLYTLKLFSVSDSAGTFDTLRPFLTTSEDDCITATAVGKKYIYLKKFPDLYIILVYVHKQVCYLLSEDHSFCEIFRI